MTTTASPLQPLDPATFHQNEKEAEKPWIVRKIVQSMTGRVVVSAYQTLQATGTAVICLSPWGDSSPLILPCIRFRDVIIHTVIVATGGAAAVATPMMDTAGGVVLGSLGSSIAVEVGILATHEASGRVANYLLIDKPANLLIPTHSKKLETTDLKKILITLQFKHTLTDASLGFFKAPTPGDSEPSLFSNIKDYISIEKGWFNPYLFASCRRPVIPRSMVPDIVFCHGPWLKGDYSIGHTLMKESTNIVALVPDPNLPGEEEDVSLLQKAFAALKFEKAPPAAPGLTPEAAAQLEEKPRPPSPTGFSRITTLFGHKHEKSIPSGDTPSVPSTASSQFPPPSHPPPGHEGNASSSPSPNATASSAPAPAPTSYSATTMIDRLNDQMNEWKGKLSKDDKKDDKDKTSDPDVSLPPAPPPERRMVVLVLSISPHRAGVWTSSARPGESVMNYTLFNGCPALVIPIKPGSPLIAWSAFTLKTLHGLKGGVDGQAFQDILEIMVNYLELCVDLDRVVLPPNYAEECGLTGTEMENRKKAVRVGMELVLAGAVRSGESPKVKKEIDTERAGVVFFRIP